VRGNAERLKYWEMSRSRKNGLGFAKLFCGRKDSQNRDKCFLKFGGIWVWISAPQEGAGGMRGGFFGGLALRKKIHNIEISAKPRYKNYFMSFIFLTTAPIL
jgi:hypothetical protein